MQGCGGCGPEVSCHSRCHDHGVQSTPRGLPLCAYTSLCIGRLLQGPVCVAACQHAHPPHPASNCCLYTSLPPVTHPRLGDPPQSLLLVVLVADSVKETSRVTPRRPTPPV
jgi:hypothetical protein